MTEGKNKSGDDKAERLAAALRANLRRRKAQARGDGAEPAPASGAAPSETDSPEH